METTKLWLVMRYCPNHGETLEIEGVFDTEEKAREICRGWGFTICPLNLNEHLPDSDVRDWPGSYYFDIEYPDRYIGVTPEF